MKEIKSIIWLSVVGIMLNRAWMLGEETFKYTAEGIAMITLYICIKRIGRCKSGAKTIGDKGDSTEEDVIEPQLIELTELEEGYLEAISSESDREQYIKGYKKLRADERIKLVGEWQLEQIRERGEEIKGEYIKKMREDPESYMYKSINKYPPYIRAVEANKRDYREEKTRIKGITKILRARER
jgi:hypothetical protein